MCQRQYFIGVRGGEEDSAGAGEGEGYGGIMGDRGEGEEEKKEARRKNGGIHSSQSWVFKMFRTRSLGGVGVINFIWHIGVLVVILEHLCTSPWLLTDVSSSI